MTAVTKIAPPRAAKKPRVETWHNRVKTDDYAWLRADNWQEVMHDPSLLAPDIREHLNAENAYLEAELADTKALQEKLFAEMKGRIKEDDSSVPAPEGAFAYYTSFVTGGQQPRFCRKPRDLQGPEQIMLDGNALSQGKAFFRFGDVSISPDQNLAAWSFDDKGSEFYRLQIRELATGNDRAETVDNTTGDASWASDGKSFFYTLQDDNHRPLKVYRHVLGTVQADDVLVYEEKDTGFFTGVGKTQSERYIVIDTHDHETSEVYLIDATTPAMAPKLVAQRKPHVEYDVDHWEDRLIIRTNADGAEDYKIAWAPISDPAPENWSDLVPHRPGTLILGVMALKNWLVRLERENGLPRIVIRNMTNGEEHAIAFDEEAYALGLGEMREYDTDSLRFSYSSMTTPALV